MLALPHSSSYGLRRERRGKLSPRKVLVLVVGLLLLTFAVVRLLQYSQEQPEPPSRDYEQIALPVGESEYQDVLEELAHIACHTLYGRCLPQFFVVGAFKAGTTSLYKWLSMHPGVSTKVTDAADIEDDGLVATMPHTQQSVVRIKEVGFFNGVMTREGLQFQKKREQQMKAQQELSGLERDPKARSNPRRRPPGPGRKPMNTYREYLNVFPHITPQDALITGEATPAYLPSPNAAFNLFHHLPWAKPIVLMREPIYRGYSRMSHIIDMMCARSPSNDMCRGNVQAPMFTLIAELVLPGAVDCLQQHWSTDYASLVRGQSRDALLTRLKRLGGCMVANDRAGAMKLSEKIPGSLRVGPKPQARGGKGGERNLSGANPAWMSSSQRQREGMGPGAHQRVPGNPPRGLMNVNPLTRGGKPMGKRPMEALRPNPNKDSVLIDKADAIATGGARFAASCVRRSVLWHSLYAPQLAMWELYFPDLLVIKAEDLYTSSEAVMETVEAYLNLRHIDWSDIVRSKYNVGFDKDKEKGSRTQMRGAEFVKEENKESVHIVEPAIRTRLQRFFDVYNRQIPQIMGETSGGTPWPYDIV